MATWHQGPTEGGGPSTLVCNKASLCVWLSRETPPACHARQCKSPSATKLPSCFLSIWGGSGDRFGGLRGTHGISQVCLSSSGQKRHVLWPELLWDLPPHLVNDTFAEERELDVSIAPKCTRRLISFTVLEGFPKNLGQDDLFCLTLPWRAQGCCGHHGDRHHGYSHTWRVETK